MARASAFVPIERKRGRTGQQLRKRRLMRTHGLCEMCSGEGRTVVADVVDHVVPLAHGGLDVDGNTRNLCHDHHRKVTAEQFGQRTEHAGVGLDGRPTSPGHPWNAAKPAYSTER